MMHLEFDHAANLGNQYICELTKFLDKISGLDKQDKEYYKSYHHYVLVDDYDKKENCFAIRVPSRTVGGLWIDDNKFITKIAIDTTCVFTKYPEDINDSQELLKFVGEELIW